MSKRQKGLEKTIASAAKYGKAFSIPSGRPWKKEAEKYIDRGCRFLEIGHELGILSAEWKSSASEIRNKS